MNALRKTPLRTKTVLDDPHAPFTLLIDEVVSAAECDALVQRIEQLSPAAAPITTDQGFVMRPDIRNNERVMFDDLDLAADLFGRIAASIPGRLRDPDGDIVAAPCGLNERFRGYRYSKGQRFAPHFDGAFVRNDRERSELTVLAYLNADFTGGATTFCDWEVSVQPKRGQVLLFQHLVRHEGSPIDAGYKYVLRSDVMYRGVSRRHPFTKGGGK